jgi:primosomal protein N' (replication factor Y)
MPAPYAQVALNLPVQHSYDYAVPAELRDRLQVGCRVRVPFGHRTLTGYCVGWLEEPSIDPKRVKPVLDVVDEEPLLDAHMLEFTRWVANHYGCAWGEALEAALPAGVRHGITSRTIQIVEPVEEGARLRAQIAELRPKAKKRAALLDTLASTDDELTPREAAQLAQCSLSTVQAARKAGVVRYRPKVITEHPIEDVEPEEPPRIVLTREQDRALKALQEMRAAGEFGVALLHGVTGSGKTEVYLRVIQDVLAEGQQAIVLVPEISLTPQTLRRFKARFPRLAVLHSHLTAAQRHEQWRAIRKGEAQVVIGARSAIFAPVQNLGLVVVDEEHENAFKQESVPRYHARDMAVVRAQMTDAVVILGSATPSLESFHNARRGRYRYLRLTRRVLDLPMPPVEVVNLTEEMHERRGIPLISRRLEYLMRKCLDADAQVMLFLNRRAYSTLFYCPRCQAALRCSRCEVPLVYHRKRHIALCHYCGEQVPPPSVCPECRMGRMIQFGAGTERIEDEIARKFPNYGVVRMDSDSTRGRDAHQRLLDEFRSGKSRILVGTQMIAKGLDFPQVMLVGVVSADTSLYLADFRAAERTFQLVEQVAGRAGRGLRGGRVVVQTVNPDHLSITCAAKHDYQTFAETELDLRQDLGYPPFGHLVRVVAAAPKGDTARNRCHKMARAIAEMPEAAELDILGPAPCPLPMLKGKSRWQLLIKARTRRAQRAATHALRPLTSSSGKTQVTLDVDPISMM